MNFSRQAVLNRAPRGGANRWKALAAVLFAGLLGTAAAQAQGFPDKPIQVVVPVAAGGGTDLLARTLGQKVSEELNHPRTKAVGHRTVVVPFMDFAARQVRQQVQEDGAEEDAGRQRDEQVQAALAPASLKRQQGAEHPGSEQEQGHVAGR